MQLSWIHTLKFKIVALAVATGVLSTLATAELLLRASRAEIERMLLTNGARNLEGTASLVANKLDLFNATLRALARHVPPELWTDRAAMERYLEDKPAANAIFDSVLATDPSGQTMARLSRGVATSELPNIASRSYFTKAIASDQPIVSEPVIGRASRVPVVLMAMATRPRDGQATGVIVGSMTLQSSHLFADLGQRDSDDGSRTLVMTRSGQLLAHPDPARVLGSAADEPGFQATYQGWRDSGSPIDTQGSASLSGEQLIAMAGIPGSDWTLVHMTPAESALRPLRSAQRTAWESSAFVGLIAALLAGLVAWWLTRPISRLRARAEAALENESDSARYWPARRGELGGLARAFQQLEQRRVQRQNETQALLQQVEAVLDHAQIGIALTRNSVFELVSQQLCDTLGAEKHELQGQPTRIIYETDAAYAALSERAHPQFMRQGFFDGEVELVRRSGARFWAHMRGRAVVPGDLTKGTVWTFEDITGVREHREQLTWSSSHDALTTLTNRAAFDGLLTEATASADTSPYCAMFIDLDHFKQINDVAGHAAGDAVLREIAAILVTQVRKADTVARLGGDEFAILLAACPIGQAREIAEKVRQAIIDYRLTWAGATFSVGASIGLVFVDGAFAAASDVLAAADKACYAAKHQGRNRVVVFSG